MRILYNILLFFVFFQSNAQVQAYQVGDVVNNVIGTDIHGNTFDLYEECEAGKHVYIKFYTTSCSYCQVVAEHFSEFYEKYGCGDGELSCVSVTGLANNEEVQTFEDLYSGDFQRPPSISTDGGGSNFVNRFLPASYPTVCIISPEKKLLATNIFPISSVEDLENSFPVGFNPPILDCDLSNDDVEKKIIRIYPNPLINDQLTIRSFLSETIDLCFYDNSGKMIYQTSSFTNLPTTIHLASGLYMLKYYNSNIIGTQIIIIK